METCVFQPAEILLPADADMQQWSTIACDQFTSDGAYWEQVEAVVGTSPSTLRLMLPEYYLGKCDEAARTNAIQNTMRSYLDGGVFAAFPHSFVFVERTLNNGAVRRGLVGQVDLEAYDFASDSDSPIRATEGTVESRLPARVRVRADAALEMPHIMLFFNDPEDAIMRQADALAAETLYDFDLMLNGGHIRGRRIRDEHADQIAQMLQEQTSVSRMQYAVGDGNHSLAAARQFWVKTRAQLDPALWENAPARYALVELVNIHDPAITFEPIHRVLFHTDADAFFAEAVRELGADSAAYSITLLASGEEKTISVAGSSIGAVIERVEAFCRTYVTSHGGEIDYIHGDEETRFLASAPDSAGILLPMMEKDELFSSVERSGPFPKKSFSIGLGPDKRYYTECRRL